jgi:UPF0755 protein
VDRKPTLLKRILAWLALTGAVLLGVLTGDYLRSREAPVLNSTAIIFEIPRGQGVREIASRLRAAGVIDKPLWFVLQSMEQGVSRRLKSGEYEVPGGVSRAELLRLFVSGRVRQHAVTLVEGWTFRRMLEAIRSHPALDHGVSQSDPQAIMAALGVPGLDPEGRFFPDTYFFPRGTPELEVLKRAFGKMQTVLAEAWERRADGLPFKTPEEALIIASIVEKETARPEERSEVAGVLVRRLQKGMPLQVDPAVIYGLGERFDGNLRRVDLATDTPYNTYVHRGLPPTPIAAPGRSSLHAALHPSPGDTLYYVATGEGGHVFSRSLEEHRRAVDRYQRKE